MFDDPSRVHDGHRIGDSRDEPEIMRDQDHGHPEFVARFHEQLEDLRLDGHIERGRRLIRNEEPRLSDESHRDHDPLTHPPGKLVGVLTKPPVGGRDPDEGEHVGRLPQGASALHPTMDAQDLGDLIANGMQGIEGRHRILEDNTDPTASDARQIGLSHREQVLSLEGRGASRSVAEATGVEPQERHHRQRLARAALPDKADGLPRENLIADATYDRLIPSRRDDVDRQSGHIEQWLGGSASQCRCGLARGIEGHEATVVLEHVCGKIFQQGCNLNEC